MITLTTIPTTIHSTQGQSTKVLPGVAMTTGCLTTGLTGAINPFKDFALKLHGLSLLKNCRKMHLLTSKYHLAMTWHTTNAMMLYIYENDNNRIYYISHIGWSIQVYKSKKSK